MTEKTIHASIYDPRAPRLFKVDRNAKAEIRTVSCSYSHECSVFDRGECLATRILDGCIFGRRTRRQGFTPRAMKYHQWIRDAKASVAGIPRLDQPTMKMARVAGFMWLPYAYMNMLKDLDWRGQFLPLEQFTVENITRIVEFRPMTQFGGELRAYQNKEIPSFVSHLAEEFPEILAEASAKSEHLQGVLASITRVGRKALLKTLVPNVGILDGGWTWDGVHLTIQGPKVGSSFLPVWGTEVRITPCDDAVMTVTEDAQVGPNTIFTD